MSLISRALLLTFLVWISLSSDLRAEASPDIMYGIYIQNDCLSTGVDMTPFLTSRALERLRDGIDLALECRASLVVPRRIWGDRQIIAGTITLRLSYRQLTDDFLVRDAGKASDQPTRFSSLALLFQYLRDSIDVCLIDPDQLESESRHALKLNITTIYLTDLNLANKVADDEGSGSPIRFLFGQFLQLTNYGREECTTRSRSFSISEIETID